MDNHVPPNVPWRRRVRRAWSAFLIAALGFGTAVVGQKAHIKSLGTAGSLLAVVGIALGFAAVIGAFASIGNGIRRQLRGD